MEDGGNSLAYNAPMAVASSNWARSMAAPSFRQHQPPMHFAIAVATAVDYNRITKATTGFAGTDFNGSFSTATLNKIGSGTLTFNSSTYVGTYSGTLNVAGGTLTLSGGTAMGDLASISLANSAGVSLNVSGGNETIGSLSGGGNSGGNVSLTSSLIIGGNNKTTTFASVISGAGSLTKTGTGTMTLTAANWYTGDTTVQAGKLSLTNRGLADAADVFLVGGTTLDLKFSGSPDAIDSLFIDGISQAVGTWGAALVLAPIHQFAAFWDRTAAGIKFVSCGRLQQQWSRGRGRLC